MTITAINKHTGSRREGTTPHYSKAVSLAIIFVMCLTAIAIGIYLVFITNIVVLFLGVICFAIGITYSYGPLPIERTPLGDIAAGIVTGGIIPLIAFQIHHPLINVALYDFSRLAINVDLLELLAFTVIVMPMITCIFNLTLANDMCDFEDDVRAEKYTLVFHIGKEKALRLFRLGYILAYLFIVIGVVTRIVPLFTLLTLLSIIPVRKNIKRFLELQDNDKTFFTTIINFLAISLPYAAFIWLGSILPF